MEDVQQELSDWRYHRQPFALLEIFVLPQNNDVTCRRWGLDKGPRMTSQQWGLT